MVENTEKEPEVCDISEIYEKFGKYQWFQYFVILLPAMFVTIMDVNYVFVAGDLDYRCLVPECEDANSTSASPLWWPDPSPGRCGLPLLRGPSGAQGCSNDSFSGDVAECTEWIYESNDTIVAEFNLACQPLKINMIGTIHNAGMLISMLTAGWLADRFGRKPVLIFCSVSGVIGALKLLATSYYPYVALEFLESVLTGGSYLITSVLLIEIAGTNKRVLAGILCSYAIYFSEFIFGVIAMVVPYWKNLVCIIYIPCIFFISCTYLMNESPRWQILNGKTEQAKKALETIADMNKVPIDKEELKYLDDVKLKLRFNLDKQEVKEGYKEIFQSKEIIKRLIVGCYCNFVAGFVYYGLILNSVLLPGNKYTNYLLSTAMSFPGELIALYLMNRIGRKLPLIVGYLLCGVMCVVSACVQTTWAKIALYLVGKMVVSACFTGIITYSMELYPTSARGSLMGIGFLGTRVGSMLAPLTPMLVLISPALPTALFGISAVIGGCLLTLTPETKDVPLMDTIDQVETIARADRHKVNSTETVITKI